jgi:putative NADH-flavin reductase
MKLALIGATGGTGHALLHQALERGHRVVAVARRPEAITTKHDQLSIAKGDVMDRASLERAFVGVEAVLSALGVVGMRAMLRPVSLYSEGGRNIIKAMQTAGVRRILAVTSGGVEDDDPSFEWFYKRVLKPTILQRAYDDMKIFERELMATDLAWTLVRPTALTDGPRTRAFRVSPRLSPPGGTKISRADVAAFMLDALENETHLRATPTLAY